MSLFIIFFAIATFGLLLISVIFLAWSYFIKVPIQYRNIGVFKLTSQKFLDSVSVDDRKDLSYLRKALFLLSCSFVVILIFSITMKVVAMKLL